MTANHIFWIMMTVGVGTFLMRASFLTFFSKFSMPPLLERLMAYLPVAILSALIIPAFVIDNGSVNLDLNNYRLPAGLLAVGVAAKTKKVLPTLIFGLACLWALQAWAPFG